MNRRKIALRALKNLCTFVGAIALFSYFYNFTVDLRHWYVTLASALACALLWFGFYIIEVHAGGVAHLSCSLARAASGWLAALRARQLPLQFPNGIEPQGAPARGLPGVILSASDEDTRRTSTDGLQPNSLVDTPQPLSRRPTLPFLRRPDPHPPA